MEGGDVLKDCIRGLPVANYRYSGSFHLLELCCLITCLNILGLVTVKEH